MTRFIPGLAALLLSTAPALAQQEVAIRFAAQVNGAAFACGQSYGGLGSTQATATPTDFRFYVHDVHLLRADGSAVPVTLTESPWQHQGVALLDFENGQGPCAQGGNAALNETLRGTAPAGSYTGLRFTLGVPERLNHQDATVAPSPFNLTAMFWNWQNGYKFVKVDLQVGAAAPAAANAPAHVGAAGEGGFALHLGSTQCVAAAPTQPGRDCRNPNRPVITLTGFDPLSTSVIADVGPVLAGVDITRNTERTPPGCMSFPNDPECRSVLPALGLPYMDLAAGEQRFFRVQPLRQAAR
ncbi:metallo-mystery pair system four-Cys motif protein [Roseococcus sp. SDR]|uniref:MbnP family copper-binding protein n=1 Tax=Roseococcus sp. SDR TaxID=2835532 RepID=UPI001BD173B9|nr:MbnP family copper-binding protein [Roseococcus sp. SDR]MBS7792328.1 metallo-mystery pair system four-Cys motif protein [Roseococcus sp. SDR]MBV1847642.1 metallo-mystery pair system four-Cys motif protein [Roseococcus sp. SDR]